VRFAHNSCGRPSGGVVTLSTTDESHSSTILRSNSAQPDKRGGVHANQDRDAPGILFLERKSQHAGSGLFQTWVPIRRGDEGSKSKTGRFSSESSMELPAASAATRRMAPIRLISSDSDLLRRHWMSLISSITESNSNVFSTGLWVQSIHKHIGSHKMIDYAVQAVLSSIKQTFNRVSENSIAAHTSYGKAIVNLRKAFEAGNSDILRNEAMVTINLLRTVEVSIYVTIICYFSFLTVPYCQSSRIR
jgi:hypothetical protein